VAIASCPGDSRYTPEIIGDIRAIGACPDRGWCIIGVSHKGRPAFRVAAVLFLKISTDSAGIHSKSLTINKAYLGVELEDPFAMAEAVET